MRASTRICVEVHKRAALALKFWQSWCAKFCAAIIAGIVTAIY